jgi:predicted transcriptional regulator
MMKRSKHAIISEILDVCKTGANKTRIVYQANLNFRTVNPYIDLLIKSNLIEVKQGKEVLYETTDKGISFLDNFNQINFYFLDSKEADRRIQSIILNQEA